MKIRTSHDYPPIPTRDADWSAVTDDYDWAPDAKDCPVGRGRTEQDAINDLVEQLVEEAYERGYKDAERIAAKQGTTNLHGPDLAVGCPDALLPDGPVCPRCGSPRAPSGVGGGSWVHHPPTARVGEIAGPGVRCYHYGPCSEGRIAPGLELVMCAECPMKQPHREVRE